MNKKIVEKTIDFGGRQLTLKTGHVAEQATSAVMAQYGETVVLATVVAKPMVMDPGYFPLSVEYQERLYAGGKIKGSRWVKRDGRPSDEEILIGRLIDRSIRPLFPKAYKKEVQVIVTVMSVDLENTPDMVAATAVSAALTASPIPWMGPIAPVKVGLKEDKYFTNPTDKDLDYSEMELVVSSTDKAIVMIEDGSKEVSEEQILGGIKYAQEEGQKLIAFINDFAKEVGAKKEDLPKEEKKQDLINKVEKIAGDKVRDMVAVLVEKEGGFSEFEELKKAVAAQLTEEDPKAVGEACEYIFKKHIRTNILKGVRPDGRKLDEIRKLSASVGLLPRTHGSGMFSRGQTQVLTIATLGGPNMGLLIETAEGEDEKRYMHFYVFPPFSTGETGRVGAPGRREIGHGALAEKALVPVLPSEAEFPYTISLVSEVLSSNGSTSMASTCGSTLALMDAGVPIKAPVGGIAMGVVVESPTEYAILTDIMGLEDFNGDMDFKIAGTAKGITALQLDVKTLDLSLEMLTKAVEQSKPARMQVLETIASAITEPRSKVSNYAPKVKTITIPQDKIGELIGPGGKNIKKIMADTKTQLDVEDDGTVTITAIEESAVDAAYAYIEGMTKEVQPGEIYEGEVKRILPFGAFVEILPGKEGLVHVSDMKEEYVSDPNEVVSLGDRVQVRVKEVDDMRRINLSMHMDPSKDKPKEDRGGGRSGGDRGGFGGGDRGRRSFGGDRRGGFDRRGNDRGGRNDRGPRRSFGGNRRDDRDGGPKSSGPHFPVSRYLDSKDQKDFNR